MGSLTACLKKVGAAISADDKATIIERARVLRGEGKSNADAALQAARELYAQVRAEAKAATDSTPAVTPEGTADTPAPDQREAAPSKPRLAETADDLFAELKKLAGGYVAVGTGRGILPVYARNPAGGPLYAVEADGKVSVIGQGGMTRRDATREEVDDFHTDLEGDRLWVQAWTRWGGSGGAAATSTKPVTELHSPSGLDWGGKTSTKPDAERQAAEDAAAELRRKVLERRRNERELERATFRDLMSNPEIPGMSLKNLEALIQAKVGDQVTPEKRALLARAIHKEAARRAAELAKQKHRDPQVQAAAIAEAMQVLSDRGPVAPEHAAAFQAGWAHAMAGKIKSTLTGELLLRQSIGYDAAKKWMTTEEGAAWYEGRPVNKLQNTGMDLRRWYEQLQDQMKADESDIQKAWAQIERATNRADLFSTLLPEGVSPGFRLYATEARDMVRPFKAWLEAAYRWEGSTAFRSRYGKSQKSDFEYMLDGSRHPSTYSYRRNVSEADAQSFETDEAFRANWLRERAREYVEQVRTVTSVLSGASSVAEAAQKWKETFVSKYASARWGIDDSLLTDAGRQLKAADAWTGGVSDIMQFCPESDWTKNLIANEQTIELPDRATPLTPPKLDSIVRDGPDLRKGQDVTPQTMKETFGLADVGFGKWVGAKQDQDHLNYAHDAFMDLAKHFGTDPKNIGFGGRMHLTIGALGRGKFAAHFSPNQPSPVGPVQVINLTNTKGDGTVYHEWTHALDHFLGGQWTSKVRPRVIRLLEKGPMTVEHVEATARKFLFHGVTWRGMKREWDAVDNAVYAMDRDDQVSQLTAYKANADKLDSGKPYWSKPEELLARAAEAWAHDTLPHQNTYLQSPWVADGKVTKATGYRGTPYPTGTERKMINEVIGALAKSVTWENGLPTVSLADFEANLPKSFFEGEARRKELSTREGMEAYRDEYLAKKAQEKAEAEAEEKRKLDELAEQKLKELEPPPPIVDAPPASETKGPLTDADLEAIFDEAAAEAREQRQEEPETPPPGEVETSKWTAEDWTVIHRHLAKGVPVLLAEEGHGIPTIHEFGRLGKTDMVGYGVFKTVGGGWTASWDGGGAMDHTPSGQAYTTVQFRGEGWQSVYNLQAAFDAAMANKKAASATAPADDESPVETWWDKELTAAGRSILLGHQGIKLPDRVLWRHIKPEQQAGLQALRWTTIDPMLGKDQDQAPKKLTRDEILQDLRNGHVKIGPFKVRIEEGKDRRYIAKVEAPGFNTVIETPRTMPAVGIQTFYERVADKLMDMQQDGPANNSAPTPTAGTDKTDERGVSSVSSAPPTPVSTNSDPTARALIAKAAELGVKGADEALTGLAKLFGSKPGRLNSFPAGFDEESYKEAKPHFEAALKSFQEAGRTLKEFFRFLIDNLGEGVKQYAIQFAKDQALSAQLGSKPSASLQAARDIEKHLLHVQEPLTWPVLFKIADRAWGGTQAAGAYTPKDAYDALEAGINLRILRSPELFDPRVNRDEAQRTIAALERLLAKVPTQTKRTAEQDDMQQFSTVPTLSFLANWVAKVDHTDLMLEPSAGVGGLAVFAKNAGAKVVLNELSSRRAGVLQEVLHDSKVYQENAEQLHNILPDSIKPTVVVMNPPFSNSPTGIKKDTMIGAKHVEQALERLEPGGRLVAIVGEGMAMGKPTFREWWKKIGAKYDVRAAVPLDGAGYAKYGTTFNNVLLVIDKVAPTGRTPVVTPAANYTEAIGLLAEVRDGRPVHNQPSTDRVEPEPDTGRPGREGVPGGDGVDVAGPAGDGGAAGVGGGKPGGGSRVGQGGAAGGRSRGGKRPGGAAPGNTSDRVPGSQDQDGRGPADAATSGGSDTAGNATGLTIESKTTEVVGELTDAVFESYTPQRLDVPGAKPHLGPLVQSSAMSSVLPPAATYTPNLPKETIEKGMLSIAQLEAVVYAGQAHEQLLDTKVDDTTARDLNLKSGTPYRRGFFIGDGTGVGKGREISGIILDNIRQGRTKHIWVSEKQELMGNKDGTGEGATRDFRGIGGDPSIIFNQNKTKADGTIDAPSGILFTTYSTLRSGAKSGDTGGFKKGAPVVVQTKIVTFTPGDDGTSTGKLVKIDHKKHTVTVEWPSGKVVEHPMAQVISIDGEGAKWRAPTDRGAAKTRLDQIVEWVGADFDGVIAFDEAHNAGNAVSIKGDRGKSDPSEQAMAVVDLQKRLPKARVVYVSATGATEVSNLSFATRLGLWGEGTPFSSVFDFISQVAAGGLATMELVARDMKQMGAYLARSLSYEGVQYSRLDHELTPIQHDIYNRLCDAWQVVLNNMEEALKVTGAVSDSGKTKNSRAKSAMLSAFWGGNQRFFNQIITSMQMPSVLDSVEADIKAGNAVVLQLVNTNEAAQERALAKRKAEDESADLEDLDLTPRDQLLQMVSKSFPVNQYEDFIGDDGKKATRLAVDSEGNPIVNKAAAAMRDQLLQDLKDITVPDGPLEILVNHFGPEITAEITGRKQRVLSGRWNKATKSGETPKAFIEKRGDASNRADAAAFMDDKKRILVFSDAGGTGFSFQADLTKANQRHRRHYLIQPGWRANKAVQGFGRTHRTNQKSAPSYVLVATNIPAHKRFLSSIARRLDQLGALTKGQRDTSSGGMFSESDNLESKYAERAVVSFFNDAKAGAIEGIDFNDLLQQLGLKDVLDPTTLQITESKLPEVRQFLNRLLSLKLEDQNIVFNAFIARMEEHVEIARQRGDLDTGMQTLRALETRVVTEEVAYVDQRTGAETKYVELELTHPTRYIPFPEAKATGEKTDWVVNVKSGRVWGRVRTGNTTKKSGEVVERYKMLGSGGMSFKEEGDFFRPGTKASNGNYKDITEDAAREMWAKEAAARPATWTEKKHMIVGAMLPIWDRLKTEGTMQVARTNTVDGRRLLGRIIHESDLKEILKRLNIASPDSKVPAAQLIARIIKGETADLANGWRLERARVSNDLRIEIVPDREFSRSQMSELTTQGAILERIGWKDRLFIPTGKPEVLEAILKSKPVVEIKSTAPEALKQETGAGAGVAMADLQDLVKQVSADWADGSPRPTVVSSVQALPSSIQAALESMGATNNTRGLVMPDGRVYLIADKLRSIDEAQSIVFHEVYGHYGMRAFLGDQYEKQMMLLRMANPKLAAEANTWHANFGRGQIDARVERGMSRSDAEKTVRLLAIEEALADRAGDAPPPNAWKTVMSKLQAALRRMGLDKVADLLERLTEAETHALLMNARRMVQRSGGPAHALEELPVTMQPKASSTAPNWYSALLREVGKSPMNAGTPQAWAQYLDALVKRGAVKADEIEWTGLREFLGLQQGKVTKDQIGQFLAGNGVRVTETVLNSVESEYRELRRREDALAAELGRRGFLLINHYDEPVLRSERDGVEFTYLDGMWVDEDESPADSLPAVVTDLAQQLGGVMEDLSEYEDRKVGAKYGDYTLPGGTNYREVLLTLPNDVTDDKIRAYLMKHHGYKRAELSEISNAARQYAMREIGAPFYRSSHWDQPNILAHIRLNDRTDADGKRVLFVEEIQSDWAQQGKKQGIKPVDAAAEVARLQAEDDAMYGDAKSDAELSAAISRLTPEQRARSEWIQRRVTEINTARVPAAPFIGKTDAWVSLALKRVIKLAVDEGYDRVAFVNGEQSAARYDLSKQVDKIAYVPSMNGGTLLAEREAQNDYPLKETGVTPEKLADYIGKEAAQRLLDAPLKDGAHTLQGSDLKVGGEGMKAFYDKIVPAVAKDVLRKVGGGQMSAVHVDITQLGERPLAERVRAKNPTFRMTPQPGFDITPSMKEKAAGGMPLFAQRRSRADVAWQKRDRNTEGPEYYGNGVGLIAIQELSADDFAPNAMPLGHGFRVRDGHTVHKFLVVDTEGGVLGQADLEVDETGNVEAIHDIVIDEKGRGAGRKVVEAILASTHGPVRLIEMVPGAEAFWNRMGAGYKDVYNDAITDWESLQGQDARAIPRAWARAGEGLETGLPAASQLAGDQGQAQPLLSQVDPVLESALKKAGVGNKRGTLARIADTFGRAVESVRSKEAWRSAGQEVRQGMLDQFYGIRRAVTNELGNLPVEQDPYVTARLANGGTSSVMRGLLLHGRARWAANGQHLEKIPGSRGLLDILKPLGEDLDLWFAWMVGNRAERLMREGRENNLTKDEIQKLQDLATPERKQAFQRAALEYAAFKRSVLDVAEEAGLINPEGRKVWDHADYIPFYRQIDEKAVFSPTGKKGLAGQSSGIRQLKGAEANVNDNMENLLMNFSRLIDASLKNNALRKTIDALGESDLVHKVGYGMTPAIVPKKQIVDQLLAAGTPEQVLLALPEEVFDGMAKMWAIKAPTDPDVIRVMVDGKPQFYRVNDGLLLRALTSFVPFDFPGLSLMRGAKRILTATVTATPEFMMRNWVRDSLASQAITRDGFSPLKSVHGIQMAWSESGGAEDMLFAGASFQSGNVDAGNPEATARHMRRALRKRGFNASSREAFMSSIIDGSARGWERWRQVGEAIENANREAVFEAARNGNRSITAAAFEAKDLMDFSLRGSWAGYQVLADVIPFLNARVQGLYRLGRSDPKRLAMVGLMMTAATLVLLAMNSGEDWYEGLQDWDKDTYWHLKIAGHHIRVPKPFELGVIFATVPERIGRGILGTDTWKKVGSRLYSNAHDQLKAELLPWEWQLFKPVHEAAFNWDGFRGRPIEGMADEGKHPSARFDARTSDTMRVIAQAAPGVVDWVGLGPKKMEHLVNGYFGTAGMYALGLLDSFVRTAEGKPERPAWRADDLPVVRAFYQVDPARATVFESDLYQMRLEVERTWRGINAQIKDNKIADAKAAMEKDKAKLKVRGLVVSAAESLSQINKQINQIYDDPKLTADQKREKIDKLFEQKNRLARKVATRDDVRAAF